jgi:hypothetical protein
MWKIIQLVIERFEIQSVVSFGTIKINDVAYEEFNNLSIYDSIKDKLFESNNIWSFILIE